MRLAWFSPLPPIPSGIADYSVEVLDGVAVRHEVEVFVGPTAGQPSGLTSPQDGRGGHGRTEVLPPSVRVHDAHEFPWRAHRQPYDVVVYQLGNSWCHDYMWPYVFQYPGLVVLHDAHLHHARAGTLLGRRRTSDYRDEFLYNHPRAPAAAAEVGLSGFAGPINYLWPMLRAVVESARTVAVHNRSIAQSVAEEYNAPPVEVIRMGVADPLRAGVTIEDVAETAVRLGRAMRARHRIPDEALVVAAYGGVTSEKRIGALLGAVAAGRPWRPDVRVVLVGHAAVDCDPVAAAASLGLADRLIVTGYVPETELAAYVAMADIASCLRWPSARETSASWLRCVAAGRPTIVTDLSHQAEVPVLDPRTWTVLHTSSTEHADEPVAVAIDIMDEDHSLALAMRRLFTDEALRARLGQNARAYWSAGHTLSHMHADYLATLERAAARPAPDVTLPGHLRPDPLGHTRRLLRRFGLEQRLE